MNKPTRGFDGWFELAPPLAFRANCWICTNPVNINYYVSPSGGSKGEGSEEPRFPVRDLPLMPPTEFFGEKVKKEKKESKASMASQV